MAIAIILEKTHFLTKAEKVPQIHCTMGNKKHKKLQVFRAISTQL